MIFRQLFDGHVRTYTYILASRPGGEALIIRSGAGKVDRYLQLIRELDLKLVKAVDTHLHADHITRARRAARSHPLRHGGWAKHQADIVSMRVAEATASKSKAYVSTCFNTPATPTIPFVSVRRPGLHRRHAAHSAGTGRTDFSEWRWRAPNTIRSSTSSETARRHARLPGPRL